jgi:hypothetical protein
MDNQQGSFKRPIDQSVGRTYTDFRSRFAVVSKLRANIWLTTALVLFVIGFIIGVAYIVDPKSFLALDQIRSNASLAASSNDPLSAVLAYNKCATDASKVAKRWFTLPGTKKTLTEQAVQCLADRLGIIEKDPAIILERFASLADASIVTEGKKFVEVPLSATHGELSPLDETHSIASTTPTTSSNATPNYVLTQDSGKGSPVYLVTQAGVEKKFPAGQEVTIQSGYKLPGGALVLAQQSVTPSTATTGQGAALVSAQSLGLTATRTVKVAFIPVFYNGVHPSTDNLAGLASATASYYTNHQDSKFAVTATVLPPITVDGPGNDQCIPPGGKEPGYDNTIYVIYPECSAAVIWTGSQLSDSN